MMRSSRWKDLCFETGGDPTARGASLRFCRGAATWDAAPPRAESDKFRFLLEWLRDPLGVAAVAPSGKALVSLITHGISERTGKVLELGPGTGVFTRGLLDRGVAEGDLTLVEQNPAFARLLQQRFPRATVLDIDAGDLHGCEHLEGEKFGAAVCGLGLRNMDARQVEAIIGSAFARMQDDAALHLFTYGLRCSVAGDILDRFGLVAERVGRTLRNMPPASVYRVARAAAI